MKKVLSLFVILLCYTQANAQDIMTKLYNRTTIERKVKVISVYANSIMYKEWEHLDGPSYEIKIENVHKIVYENGKVDYFTPIPALPTYKPIKFQCYLLDITGILAPKTYGLETNINCGINIYDYVYTGLSVGFGGIFSGNKLFYDYLGDHSGDFADLYVPIGLNVKYFPLINKKILPFINLTIGGFIGMEDYFRGAYCQAGLGFDVSYFSFGVRYNMFLFNSRRLDTCSISVGMRFGGRKE